MLTKREIWREYVISYARYNGAPITFDRALRAAAYADDMLKFEEERFGKIKKEESEEV